MIQIQNQIVFLIIVQNIMIYHLEKQEYLIFDYFICQAHWVTMEDLDDENQDTEIYCKSCAQKEFHNLLKEKK